MVRRIRGRTGSRRRRRRLRRTDADGDRWNLLGGRGLADFHRFRFDRNLFRFLFDGVGILVDVILLLVGVVRRRRGRSDCCRRLSKVCARETFLLLLLFRVRGQLGAAVVVHLLVAAFFRARLRKLGTVIAATTAAVASGGVFRVSLGHSDTANIVRSATTATAAAAAVVGFSVALVVPLLLARAGGDGVLLLAVVGSVLFAELDDDRRLLLADQLRVRVTAAAARDIVVRLRNVLL